MGEAAGQAEERVHLVEREVTNVMYISKEGNRKTVVKKAQDGKRRSCLIPYSGLRGCRDHNCCHETDRGETTEGEEKLVS